MMKGRGMVNQRDSKDEKLDLEDALLGLGERRAPIAILSNKSRSALVECFKDGDLQRQKGVWRGSPAGQPVSGNTVASLCRDGLLVVTKSKQSGSAQLTERGAWFVRTLIAAGTDNTAD
jgi:hypothetical protein